MADIKSSYALLEKIIVLKRSTLFQGVSTSELRLVAAVADELHFKHGDRIVSENEIGDALYLVVSGSVRIVKDSKNGHAIELAVLGDGESFGEMSAIDEEVRSATVYAARDCEALRISKDDLHNVLRDSPQIAIELLKLFVKRLRKADLQIGKMAHSESGGVR